MQKFAKGDYVRINKDLGSMKRHFTNDCDAVVIGSYKDKYGGSDIKSYTLFIKGEGEVSWYHEDEFLLIEKNRIDLLDKWETERNDEIKLKSDLDWIFENGNSVIKSPHGASIESLAKCFGLNDLWGSNGEGITYYENFVLTLSIAQPFLKSCNKAGWLEFCDSLKSINIKDA